MGAPTRRQFIKTTAATAAALAANRRLHVNAAAQTLAAGADPVGLELANEALNVARGAGASYADVRIGRYRRQYISTRERQVSAVSDDESYGVGIRTLVNGCWGFAATSTMTRDGVQKAARDAVSLSRAARTVQRRLRDLPSRACHRRVDDAGSARPGDVPLEDKIALLLKANEAALKVQHVSFVSSELELLREVKTS
jgi:TldD protein